MDATKWTQPQLDYMEFLANRPKSKNKAKRQEAMSREEFAKTIGVDPATLYRWQALPGFKAALFEHSLSSLTNRIPDLNKAMVGKAMGMKEFKTADVPAYTALMRQFELLKADKIDHTTNGKDMPAPIISVARDTDAV